MTDERNAIVRKKGHLCGAIAIIAGLIASLPVRGTVAPVAVYLVVSMPLFLILFRLVVLGRPWLLVAADGEVLRFYTQSAMFREMKRRHDSEGQDARQWSTYYGEAPGRTA